MPYDGEYYSFDPERSRRQRAWKRHYVAKGCSDFKASCLARKKCERKRTWPPS